METTTSKNIFLLNNNLSDTMIKNTRLYEYMSASKPNLSEIPVLTHSHTLYESGPSKVIPFDLSKELNINYTATSPNLLASFIRVANGDTLECYARAASNAFYIIKGSGECYIPNEGKINYSNGDIIVIPDTKEQNIKFTSHIDDTAIYWINDEPLLKYLNVVPNTPNFKPSLFKNKVLLDKIEEISHEPNAKHKNRLGVLLGNEKTQSIENGGTGTLTLTPTLWSLLNVLPANTYQKPHRHNSIALDLCVSGGCNNVYTLMGPELDENGNVKNPVKCTWEDGSVFVTPPGWWHSHHNDGEIDAYVLPIQDAGLYTYQRTLNIEFS